MEERQVPSLVDLDPVVVEDAGVVLDEPIGDDDVTNAERRVEAARDPGEDDDPGCGLVEQHRGHGRHGNLPDSALREHDRLAVERPAPNPRGDPEVHLGWIGQRLAELGKLWLERRHDGDRDRALH
jgi:hypothetical protein